MAEELLARTATGGERGRFTFRQLGVELLERSLDDRSLDPIEPAAALGAITARLHGALAAILEAAP